MTGQNKLSKFLQELKRRKVVGVIIVYATVAFILLQLALLLEESLHLPDWFTTLITILLIIGFPIAIIFSWIFDVSSKGISKTESEPVKATMVESSKSAPDKSIIVLPFDNLSPDPDQEYFSDGLTEEIITDLSFIKDLLVISRSSAMTFKGTKQTIKDIACKVNVRYVLEGSVRKSGNNLRIVAQLIDADNDAHIWAEKFSGTLDDIFDIQEKVSRSIVDALKVKLTSSENKQISEHPIDNVHAYDYYLRARRLFFVWTEEALEKASLYLNTALEIGGDNEYLYAGLALVYYQYVNAGIKTDVSYLDKAKGCIKKIFEINPDSEYGHRSLGFIQHKLGNIQEAVNHTKRALKINPNDADNYGFLAYMYSIAGKPEKADQLTLKMLELDPLLSMSHWLRGFYYLVQGKFPDAIEPWQKAHQLESMNPAWRLFYAQCLGFNNRFRESFTILDSLIEEIPNNLFAWIGMFFKNALKGEKDLAIQSVNNKMLNDAKWHEFNALLMAESYSLIKEKEKAIDWCEIAFKQGLKCYPFFSEYDPFLDNVRGEVRFKKLMERMKYEWETFKV